MRNFYNDDEITLHYPTIEELLDCKAIREADAIRERADLTLNQQKPPGSWRRYDARLRDARPKANGR